jgi:polyisoprenoid-binding protein YceI
LNELFETLFGFNTETIINLNNRTMNKAIKLLSLVLFGIMSTAAVNYIATEWSIDKSHSNIDFEVRHFFTPVNGTFHDYNATVNFDPANLEESMIDVEIMVNSIDTRNERRNGHLKTADFFNAEKYPKITFKSSKIESKGDNKFVAHGDLTIKDVTKKIEMPFTLLGVMDHPRGGKVAGITSEFVIDRNVYGVGTGDWVSDAVVGKEVTATLNLELNSK